MKREIPRRSSVVLPLDREEPRQTWRWVRLRVERIQYRHMKRKVHYVPEKQSILDAIEHLFARNREMRPLNFGPALPMKDEW